MPEDGAAPPKIPYRKDKKNSSASAALDFNHSHFILINNTENKGWGSEIEMRASIEKRLSEKLAVPNVLLVVQGGRNTLTTDVSRMLAQLLGGARTLVASDARCRSEVVSRMAAASLTAALSSVVGPVLAPVLGRGADGPARTREALQKVHTVFLSAAATASQRKRTSQVEACLAEIGRLGFACKPGNGSNIPVAVLNSSWFFNGQPPFGRRKRRILLTPVTAL